MKGNYFFPKSPHGAHNDVYISHYQSTEHDSGQYCVTFCVYGASHISLPADLQSSAIWDSSAEGRGCTAVEADPTLAKRRKRRFARVGSAMRTHCVKSRFW